MALVLLDCDGVVADWIGHMLSNLAVVSPTPVPHRSQIRTHDIFDYISNEARGLAEKMLDDGEWWLNIPVMEGAPEGVSALREAGHRVQWVTAPWFSCRTWGWARRTWLHRYFKADPKDILIGHQKQLVRGDVFIDDKPRHVEAWGKANPGRLALAYAQPWNMGKGLIRFEWSEVKGLVEKLAA